jgi:tripartite-type tricarboxylate transporter receptor subunit TctC
MKAQALFFAACLAASCCSAQTFPLSFPSKPVSIIVPYPAGGTVDAFARGVAPVLGESLRQPVLVENRPGASSIIGMSACAKAAPDGHTMCFTVADSLTYNPAMFSDLPYNPEKDFAPVINLGWANNVIVAWSGSPFSNFREMIAYAKANPGKLNWATWGIATVPDVYLRWFRSRFGVDIVAIPYKGAAGSNPAVATGEAHLTYTGYGVARPMIKSGKWKALATVGERRSQYMPDVMTLVEDGADPGLRGYFAAFTTGGTPRPVVERLNAELTRALRTPKMQAVLSGFTLDFIDNSVDEFTAFTRRDRENAAKVFRSIGITPTTSPQ